MRREKYSQLARDEAQKILTPKDYATIIEAIETNTTITFDYIRTDTFKGRYHLVLPIEFFLAQNIYLQAYHQLHDRNHTFKAWQITNVHHTGDIIRALLNMEKYRHWWDGTTLKPETIQI